MLYVENLSVLARGKVIINNLSLRAYPGDVVLVWGPSGSGKTTFLRALCGVASSVYGMKVLGRARLGNHKLLDPKSFSRIGLYVVQEPWFSISFPYPATELAAMGIDIGTAMAIAKELGVHDKLFSTVISLSAGEAQRIALLEAILCNKRLILIDEVTSYLDREARARVVDLIKKVASEGSIVIVVDHDAELWRGVYSYILWMRDGSAKIVNSADDLPLKELYKQLDEAISMVREAVSKSCSSRPVLVAKDLWYRYPDSENYIIRGLSLEIYEGSLTAIAGRSGAGKTTLLKILAGVLKPSRGYIRREGRALYVPENPLLYLSSPTPREELRDRIDLAVEFGLERALDTPIAFLSSGERRRLAIASALARGAKVVLIDEPTVGLDMLNAIRLLKAVAKAIEKGCTLIVATHGEEILSASSKIVSLG